MTEAARRGPLGPEIRDRHAFIIAGLSRDYDMETRVEIPSLWQRFAPMIGSVPGQVGATTYGVCITTDPPGEQFTYIAAVEVESATGLRDFATYEIPAARYAVFTHVGSLDGLDQTMDYIFGTYMPESGYRPTGTPDFELYDERFNPDSRDGELEIWVPIELV